MSEQNIEKATFAAGCFWGVEQAFFETEGVIKTTVGYEGGHKENPTYKEVCTDTTGHAEVVEIEFDKNVISYRELVEKFWQIHNPTQVNRQGPDVGSQYRSSIFFHSEEQREVAEASKSENAENFAQPIATEIVSAATFYPAEDYHQKYFQKNAVSCHI